ncbi:hypothetical protein CR513_53010, partial [Mucuna pruriens]
MSLEDEDENDLNLTLALGLGSPKRARQFPPSMNKLGHVTVDTQRKSETALAPFPWATIHNHKYLLQREKFSARSSCEHKFEVSLDMEEKVSQLPKFIQKECGRQNTKPISTEKKAINSLFLLLNQMMGC